jgi:hypothetical protein
MSSGVSPVELALLITQGDRLSQLPELARETAERWAGMARQRGMAATATTRLYFGNEFCHYLLPSAAEVRAARAAARAAGLAFTLATPYLPDLALDELAGLLPLLEAGDEVVINDWGVLRKVRAAAPGLRPVIGRLMNKILRDHRTPDGEAPALLPDGQGSPEDRALAQTGLGAAGMRALLGRFDVARVEFDWGPRGFLWDAEGVAASVYLPFGYVASGRVCPLASLDRPRDEKFTVDPPSCPRPCRRFRLELRGAGARTPLLHVGNTVFYEVAAGQLEAALEVVERIPGGRVVWQPDLPM